MKKPCFLAGTGTLVPILLLFLLSFPAIAAEPLRLGIQPVLPPERTVQAWQPLADYLGKAVGRPVKIVPSRNFFTFWERLKKGESFDLVLTGAHLTDFLVERMDYRPLARIPGQVSYTLVTGQDTLVFDPNELIGKRVATLGSPSLGALRVAELFPNPMRQPSIVEVPDSESAARAVLEGRAVAAIIPTPLVQQYPDLNTVTTTSQVPHIALSASPELPDELVQKLREALVNAGKTPEGKKMLSRINMPAFIPASADTYEGYSRLLQGVWGY